VSTVRGRREEKTKGSIRNLKKKKEGEGKEKKKKKKT